MNPIWGGALRLAIIALRSPKPRVLLTSVRASRERDRGETVLALPIRHDIVSIISVDTSGNNVLVARMKQVVLA